jgi:tRNA pseudouridine55 synthase
VQRRAPVPDPASVRDHLGALTGDIEQQPPVFSAKHVAGERAYRLARRGVAAILAPVAVRVMHWEILEQTSDTLRARITCSGGTYVRALARDLGRLVGSAAHCRELRRLAAGAFRADDAVAPDAVTVSDVVAPQRALPSLPQQRLDAAAASGVRQGRSVAALVPGARAILIGADDEFLALAERSGDCWLPRVVFPDA